MSKFDFDREGDFFVTLFNGEKAEVSIQATGLTGTSYSIAGRYHDTVRHRYVCDQWSHSGGSWSLGPVLEQKAAARVSYHPGVSRHGVGFGCATYLQAADKAAGYDLPGRQVVKLTWEGDTITDAEVC